MARRREHRQEQRLQRQVPGQLAPLSANNANNRGRSSREGVFNSQLTAPSSNKRDLDNTSSGLRLANNNNNNNPVRTRIRLLFAGNISTVASEMNRIGPRLILRKQFSGNVISDTIAVGGIAATRPSCL